MELYINLPQPEISFASKIDELQANNTRLADQIAVESRLKRQTEEERDQLRMALQQEKENRTVMANCLQCAIAKSYQRADEVIFSLESLKVELSSYFNEQRSEEGLQRDKFVL